MKTFVMAVFVVAALTGCYEQPKQAPATGGVIDGCAPYRVDAGKITAACG